MFYGVFAYLDPASGSMLVQALLAALVAAGIAFRRFLFAPILWIKKRREK